MTTESGFWENVEKTDECWRWKGSPMGHGYGYARWNRKRVGAHRIAWVLSYGLVPNGLFVLHTCDNRICVRNDDEGWYEVNGILYPRRGHLWIGTQQANMDDMREKGRGTKGFRHSSYLHPDTVPRGARHYSYLRPELIPRGERRGSAKLTASDVREIRIAYADGGVLQRELGQKHGVSQTLIGQVVRRVIWTHVD